MKMYRCFCNSCNLFFSDDLTHDALCPYCESADTEVMDDDLDEEVEDEEITWEEFIGQKIAEIEREGERVLA